jgi:hypothetical protein
MNDKHIIEVLDNASIARLSEIELTEIRAHVKECVGCRDAFEAAQLSAAILKQRVQVTVEPSPFFQTRVMAALREQQALESIPAVFRLWKSAKVLVSSMAVTTAALAALSFALPATPATPGVEQAAPALSAESVIMGQASDEMSYEQVLSTIYADDDDAR